MNPWLLFPTSFVVALSGALMPGPVLAVTVRESTRNGLKTGPLVILGHGILEICLIAALLFGFSAVFRDPLFLTGVGILGGAVLLGMGIFGWFRSGVGMNLNAASVDGPSSSDIKIVRAGIITSLSNPYWFIWWATIGMAYLGQAWKYGWAGLTSFYSGHIMADLLWYSLISAAVAGGRKFLKPGVHRWVLRFCSLFIAGLGIWFIHSGMGFWLQK